MSQVVAIAGATGAVGTEFIKLLEQRNYPLQKLKLLASARSVGKQLRFREQTLSVEELRPEAFQAAAPPRARRVENVQLPA